MVSRAQERRLLLNPEPVAVAELLQSAVAAQRERFRAADIELSVAVAPGIPSVIVDPDRIHEAIANLLDNAQRHTPRGGTVTITAQPGTVQRGTAVIEVKDSGRGFPHDHAERIFDRFQKDPGSPASGLGLTIARAIMDAHHGTLTAHSAGPGQGARFTITLPAHAPR